MQIADIRATPVTVEFSEPEVWSHGTRDCVTAIVVEVETDTGLVGVGESVPAPNPDVTVAALQSCLALVSGMDPRRVSAVWQTLQLYGGWAAFPFFGNAALAGIEIACWDILGKSLGVPVHALLGGRVRDEIEIMGFIQNASPDIVRREAERLTALGFKTLYTKVGFDLAGDIAVTRALREGSTPDVAIRVDPNEAYSPGDTLRFARQVADCDLQYIEQPIGRWSINELRTLRMRSPVPIAANQSSWLNTDVIDIVSRRAADVIMTDPWQAGGLGAFLAAARICEAAGLPLVYHSFAPLSIGMRAAAQVLAVSTACGLAHQTYNHMIAQDVVVEAVDIGVGRLAVDDRPGIGVELDRARMQAAHESYLSRGYVSPYGRPGWRQA